jgi:hypothetical protein
VTAQGTWIRVDVKPRDKDDGSLIVFSQLTGKREQVAIDIDEDDFGAARQRASGAVERFVKAIALQPPPADARSALLTLYDDMYTVATAMMTEFKDMGRLRGLFDAAPKGWWKNPNAPARVVDVVGRDRDFPFELLPVFDHRPAGHRDSSGALGLVEIARRFLGFTCVVRRIGRNGQGTGHNLENGPLNISVMRHGGLLGSAIEAGYYERLQPHVAVDGPWPGNDLDDEAVIQGVGDALFDGHHRLLAKRDTKRTTQIHHFACHCLAEDDADGGHALVLAGDDGKDHRVVPLQRLASGYGARFQALEDSGQPDPHDKDLGLPPRGLVFLNACSSGDVDPARLSSFPNTFRMARHRGVIGVETAIPDGMAAMYAMWFYRQLLAGDSIGEAMVKARVHLLEKHRSPLGLLYTLHADPDIKVTHKVPEADLPYPPPLER